MASHEHIPSAVGGSLILVGALFSGFVCFGPVVCCAFMPDAEWGCVFATFIFSAPLAALGLYLTIPGFAMVWAQRAGKARARGGPDGDLPLSD